MCSILYYSKTIKNNKTEENDTSIEENNQHEEEKIDESDLNISQETRQKSEEKKIENILILGIDKQENASDTIIILTLDKINNTAKLTSIMRDTYVDLGDGTANKINYAYHYGGAQLTIFKLNELFNLDISKYIKIDFNGLIKIVDYLGGINLSITNEEKNYINGSCNTTYLTHSGEVLLDGDQVLAYSRLRKIDSDFERTARQRKVLFAIFKKLKEISITDYVSVSSQIFPCVETNFQTFEILKLGMFLNKLNSENIQDFRIPIDGTSSDNLNGVYHLDWNKEKNTEAFHNFIYGSVSN
jgi:LCP family protein required for cell wall assembly